jgi:Tol biopolymer transport system component
MQNWGGRSIRPNQFFLKRGTMMTLKSLFQCFHWLFLLVFLASCGTVPMQPPASPTAASAPTVTPAPPTRRVEPVETATLAPTISTTATKTPRPTRTPLPFFTLEGLRVAYVIKGNLYVQESGGQPLQLTSSGADGFPQFSDDGQRLIVHRGPDVYLVNIDGSGERELALGKQLARLGHGYDSSTDFGAPLYVKFVPGTHQLLFQTGQQPFDDLLLIDVDSGAIKLLFPPGAQVGYFQASPDGKMAWVWVNDHIDVISLDGKSKQRLTDYPPVSEGYYTEPALFWTQDSRKLSLFLPAEESGLNGGPKPRTIWQFSLDGNSPIEIHLDPPPELINYSSISPNGNWVVYTCLGTPGVYIGNLRDSTIQHAGLMSPGATYYWSPDSEHFMFDSDGMFLGNIQGEITPISGGGFKGWIDNSSYLYGGVAMGKVDNEGTVVVIGFPESLRQYLMGGMPLESSNFTFVFIKPK